VPYQVFQGDGTRSFIVSRNGFNGFLYDNDCSEAAPGFIRPGSATAHMGMVEWRQVRRVEDVPARLLAIMAGRALTFEPGDIRSPLCYRHGVGSISTARKMTMAVLYLS
jgi:hypothetical protein